MENRISTVIWMMTIKNSCRGSIAPSAMLRGNNNFLWIHIAKWFLIECAALNVWDSVITLRNIICDTRGCLWNYLYCQCWIGELSPLLSPCSPFVDAIFTCKNIGHTTALLARVEVSFANRLAKDAWALWKKFDIIIMWFKHILNIFRAIFLDIFLLNKNKSFPHTTAWQVLSLPQNGEDKMILKCASGSLL